MIYQYINYFKDNGYWTVNPIVSYTIVLSTDIKKKMRKY